MTGFWRTLLHTLSRNPISAFAVLCVAVTAGWLAYMSERQLDVLESPDWCSRAIDAERISPGSTYVGLTTCVELLKIQLEAVATDSHIDHGVFGMVLLVLIVVVVAGAKANFKLGKDGIEGDVSRDAVAGAEHVEQAAHEATEEVRGAP